jgi:hypothetical protein
MNRSFFDDLPFAIVGLLLYFGPGLLGMAVLFLSARHTRSRLGIIGWGLVAACLMLVECVELSLLAGLASATSTSQHGYRILEAVIIILGLSLGIYFALAFQMLKRRGERNAATPPKWS